MSLFENSQYRWRETYFLLFKKERQPTLHAVEEALRELDIRYVLDNARAMEDGGFESCTLLSPQDFAAMDISYVEGEETREQVDQLMEELTQTVDTDEERSKLARLPEFDARMDIFHFEQVVSEPGMEDEEDFLDPGSLLIVLERLAKICDGVGVDPQSGAVM